MGPVVAGVEGWAKASSRAYCQVVRSIHNDPVGCYCHKHRTDDLPGRAGNHRPSEDRTSLASVVVRNSQVRRLGMAPAADMHYVVAGTGRRGLAVVVVDSPRRRVAVAGRKDPDNIDLLEEGEGRILQALERSNIGCMGQTWCVVVEGA